MCQHNHHAVDSISLSRPALLPIFTARVYCLRLLPVAPLCHRVVARQLVEVARKIPSELLVRAEGIVKGLEAREAGERALESL